MKKMHLSTEQKKDEEHDDKVTETSMESFPASDPPGWIGHKNGEQQNPKNPAEDPNASPARH